MLLAAEKDNHINHNGPPSRWEVVTSSPARVTQGSSRNLSWESIEPQFVIWKAMPLVKEHVNEEARTEIWRSLFEGLDPKLRRVAKFETDQRLKSQYSGPAPALTSSTASEYELRQATDELKASQKSLKNRGEAANIVKLEQLIEGIDDTIEIRTTTAQPALRRSSSFCSGSGNSCVVPNRVQTKTEQTEKRPRSDWEVDWNADEVRAMIARLIKYSDGEWTVDNFLHALGHFLTRKDLIEFLSQKGPHEGARSKAHNISRNRPVFDHAREFFQNRQRLGVALPVRNAEVARKRKREPLAERAANTVEQTAAERKKRSKANFLARDFNDEVYYKSEGQAMDAVELGVECTPDMEGAYRQMGPLYDSDA